MTKFIASVIIYSSLLFLGCRNKNMFQGRWNIVHFEFYDHLFHDTTVFHLTDKEYLRNLRDKLPSSSSTGNAEAILDSMMNCFLELKADSSFFLNDMGFLLRSEPGFSIDREVAGKWRYDTPEDQIILEVIPEFKKSFTVATLTRDSLVLEEQPLRDEPPISKLILVRE